MFRRSSIDRNQWFRHCWQNRLQTALLLIFLGGYLLLLGGLIWGSAAAIWLPAVIGGLLLLAPTGSPHLLMKLSGARPVSRLQAPELYRTVETLAQRAELETMPALYSLPTRQPNALAVGSREEPIIGISNGLLQLLNQRELAGVLAHEISHLRNGDLRVMQLAELVSRLTNSLSLFGQILLLLNLPLLLFSEQSINWLPVLILIFAPQVSTLAQLGLSRVREFNADLGAAALTGDPHGLAVALQKIERQVSGFFRRLLPVYYMPNWLRTHPATSERVRRLLELNGSSRELPSWRVHPAYCPPIIPQPAKVIQMSPKPGRQRAIYQNRRWYDD